MDLKQLDDKFFNYKVCLFIGSRMAADYSNSEIRDCICKSSGTKSIYCVKSDAWYS